MATSSFLRRLEARMVLGFEELASGANTKLDRSLAFPGIAARRWRLPSRNMKA
jgi:hypothetical protein